jgi:hypothetical protein
VVDGTNCTIVAASRYTHSATARQAEALVEDHAHRQGATIGCLIYGYTRRERTSGNPIQYFQNAKDAVYACEYSIQ